MTAPELKPCPFCGGEASISKDHDPDGSGAFYAVKCRKCRAKSPEIYAVETCNIHFTQVRDAWNRRADIAAVPAHVRVKPLVWEDMIGRIKCDTTSIVGPYEVYQDVAWITLWFNGARIGGACASIEAAKSAAQADYEARIFAVLEPQPNRDLETCGKCMGSGYGGHPDSGHPCADCSGIGGVPPTDTRDEVIARLVDALENKLHDQECPCNACSPMLAALAAAKAVQRG